MALGCASEQPRSSLFFVLIRLLRERRTPDLPTRFKAHGSYLLLG
jgi:hypothetical protein